MERLDKTLANAGAGTRSAVKALLKAGRVQVNGLVEKDGSRHIDPAKDTLALDGEPIGRPARQVWMLNKPAGCVTATEDPGPTVMDYLPPSLRASLRPVGRLDKDTEGLLLLTNDGDLVNGLTHPRHEVEKHYEVRVRGNMDNIPRLSEPMELDGYAIRPAGVTVLERGEDSAKIRMTIHEGRNRQIRRMCEKAGLEVRRLKRVAIGDMPLDPKLKSGAWRELTQDELAYLQDLCAGIEE